VPRLASLKKQHSSDQQRDETDEGGDQRDCDQGRQAAGLSLKKLIEVGPPAAWRLQRKVLGLES